MSTHSFAIALLLAPVLAYGGGFDAAQSQLPPKYSGMDFAAVLKSAHKLTAIKKGEFETKSDFEDRKYRVLSTPFHGALRAGDIFAFSLAPNPGSGNIRVYYDADSEEFTVGLGRDGFPGSDYVCPTYKMSSAGSYPAGNAFGAKVTVQRSVVQASCIGDLPRVSLSFKTAPKAAAEVKSNLRVLVLGSISDPAVSQESDYLKPTITSPYEVSSSASILHLQSPEIWVYDWKSGQVWARHAEAASSMAALNLNENTPLHAAIWREERATIPRIIAESPQFLNERNRFGATPLHLAVWKNDRRAVQALLAAGADKSIMDNEGQTPLDDARTKKFSAIVELLEKD